METNIYSQPKLPYALDALEPTIRNGKTFRLKISYVKPRGRFSTTHPRLGTIYSISLHSLLTALISLKDIFLKPLKSNLAHLKNLRLSLRMLEHQFSDQAGSGFPKIRMESCL